MARRPIRFLAATVGGWIAFRLFVLWPVTHLPEVAAVVAPPVAAATLPAGATAVPALAPRWRLSAIRFAGASDTTVHVAPEQSSAPPRASNAAVPATVAPAAASPPPMPMPTPPGVDLPPEATPADRWQLSVWAIARAGGGGATPFASQLGGSQAGARLTWLAVPSRRIAIAARVSSALGSRQREAAVGLDWQPTRAPVHVFVEQRIAIEGARGGPAAGLIGGVGPVGVGAGLAIEAYAQAGAIARDGIERFADGSARLTRRVGPVDLGLGAWGGAQRGAARLDVGPTLGIRLPVGGRALRLAVDWRERIAGDARPGSGPAISLGTDL